MKANVGGADKVIRLVLGLVIIAAGFYLKSWWGVVGVVPLLTGFFNFCPLYTLFKIDTAKKKS